MTRRLPNKICGYQVVRLPAENYDEEGRGAYWKDPHRIGDIFYGGTDRMPWFELDEDFYAGILPPELLELRKEVLDEPADFAGCYLTRNIGAARHLLDHANAKRTRNEIVAIYSKKLETIKGAFTPDSTVKVHWCGFDVEDLGGNSLILEGLFSATDNFQDFVGDLNAWGLLDDESVGHRLIAHYEEAADQELVEELSYLEEELGPSYGIDFVWVGRVEEE